MTRVTVADMRRAKVCPGSPTEYGARDWFRDNGLSFMDFARNGIEAAVLLEKDVNADVLRVIAAAEEREAHGQ